MSRPPLMVAILRTSRYSPGRAPQPLCSRRGVPSTYSSPSISVVAQERWSPLTRPALTSISGIGRPVAASATLPGYGGAQRQADVHPLDRLSANYRDQVGSLPIKAVVIELPDVALALRRSPDPICTWSKTLKGVPAVGVRVGVTVEAWSALVPAVGIQLHPSDG